MAFMSAALTQVAELDWSFWIPVILGGICLYMGIREAWLTRRGVSAAPVTSTPLVITTIDPEQSQISYSVGPRGLQVDLLLTIENHLDTNCRMKRLTLEVEVANECLQCRYYGFLYDGQICEIKEVLDLSVPSRELIRGWARFGYTDGMVQMDNLRKFILTAQAIGEPEQQHFFSIFDHHSARIGHSPITILSREDLGD